ncbi:hypothetical protein KP004_00670 [Geomonas oryzisoli]|uniref:Uncharacterized protein n=1 Tax=Geomonas oryzisoli TaxID=2847992 RepID=A0ABX8J8P5_9BACT|nr:hypothetical protein [Geomonas oryzisoli]QWV93737.1 hypothetical protein KP004_00670 [Geomonas oryzisoli]
MDKQKGQWQCSKCHTKFEGTEKQAVKKWDEHISQCPALLARSWEGGRFSFNATLQPVASPPIQGQELKARMRQTGVIEIWEGEPGGKNSEFVWCIPVAMVPPVLDMLREEQEK